MWLSIIFLIVLAVLTMRISSQGMFSAMIMAVLTICCAALAIGTYEWTTINWVGSYLGENASAAAIAATFGIPLLLLRLLVDKLVPRTCLLSSWAERIGGGFFGFLSAYIVVGVMAFAVQHIPFNGSILGFGRLDMTGSDPTQVDSNMAPPDSQAESEIWLMPDRFSVGLVSLLSAGTFSGPESLGHVNPDLVQANGWIQAANAEVNRYAPPKSVSVVETGRVDFVYDYAPPSQRDGKPAEYDEIAPKTGHEFRTVTLKIGREARDENKSIIFTLRQIRLVGSARGSSARVQHHPVALLQEDANEQQIRYVKSFKRGAKKWPIDRRPYSPRSDAPDQVSVVFEVPTGFVPAHIAYKHAARATVSFSGSEGSAAAQPSSAASDAATTNDNAPTGRRRRGSARTTGGRSRGGNVRGATPVASKSHFGDAMPIELQSYVQRNNVDISRGRLAQGYLIAEIPDQEGGPDPKVSRFSVPRGKRLLHLHVNSLQAKSGLGSAITSAVRTLQNYTVTDKSGRQYKIVGKYAKATVDSTEVFEVQYYPDQAGTVGGLSQFTRIDESALTTNDDLAYLFLVDPNAQIVTFSTGGSRKDDLSSEGLVAPN